MSIPADTLDTKASLNLKEHVKYYSPADMTYNDGQIATVWLIWYTVMRFKNDRGDALTENWDFATFNLYICYFDI